ncbi:MAG: HEAT repeat domain-containing protein [Anaerolineae bacterium]|nr:HEAT repeat domain-containing protein [Anaerolineae bacterium]MDW8297932.1 HEAT repeat domain-containing protein [Anaerolineae bacterium]
MSQSYAPALAQTPDRARRLTDAQFAHRLHHLENVSAEALHAALCYGQRAVRQSAAESLAQQADSEALAALHKALTSCTPAARTAAARQLAAFDWDDAQPLWSTALCDSDPQVRMAAIHALFEVDAPEALDLLAEQYSSVRSPRLRAAILEHWAERGGVIHLDLVRAALDDPSPHVCYAAATAMLDLLAETALAPLAEAVQRRRGEARAAILRGIFNATNYLGIQIAESADCDAVLDALEIALRDSEPEVRRAAVWLAAWIAHPRAASLLEAAYRAESDPEVQAHMLYVTVNLNAPSAPALLAHALDSAEPILRDQAVFLAQRKA